MINLFLWRVMDIFAVSLFADLGTRRDHEDFLIWLLYKPDQGTELHNSSIDSYWDKKHSFLNDITFCFKTSSDKNSLY